MRQWHKIGVLESEGTIDSTSPHYDENRMYTIEHNVVNTPVSTHASLVTAIVAGERVLLNGYVYAGVAPKAEVYITRSVTTVDFLSSLEALADLQNHKAYQECAENPNSRNGIESIATFGFGYGFG